MWRGRVRAFLSRARPVSTAPNRYKPIESKSSKSHNISNLGEDRTRENQEVRLFLSFYRTFRLVSFLFISFRLSLFIEFNAFSAFFGYIGFTNSFNS